MKIIEQSWCWMQKPANALELIEKAGRTCYKSDAKIGPDTSEKFARMLVKRGHESVIEHAVASVRFITNRGNCYDEETEVLTREGWKYFTSLTGDEEFACLDDNGFLQWEKSQKNICEDWQGELLHFETSSIDLLVTPDHNMWVYDYDKRSPKTRIWKFLKANQLTNGRYQFKKSANWIGKDVAVTIPAHRREKFSFPEKKINADETCDLFELLGLWITDGSYRNGKGHSGSCILISQSKPKGVKRITDLCEKLGFACSWYRNEARIDNLRLYEYVESLFGHGAKTETAFVPSIIKESSSRQISRFLDGVILGDGNIHSKNGHVVVYTASKKFADDLQELFLKIGLSANIRFIQPRYRGEINGNPVKTTKPSFVVSVHGKKRSVHTLRRDCAKHFGKGVAYNGKVFCVTVPYHRLYVRRNGKAVWCGNSHELVRHRLASYSQESTRYVRYDGNMEFIRPVWWDDWSAAEQRSWERAMQFSETEYLFLLAHGSRPEQAREVLPNSLKTEIVTTANLREWRHIFRLRCSKAAHPQIRSLMTDCLKGFHREIPVIFDEEYEKYCL